MAADRSDSSIDTEADARLRIQEIIDELKYELNLTEPGNQALDKRIETLDRIFTEYVDEDEENADTSGQGKGKSIDISQARLDIEAFSLLATISHQRIRRVAASTWTFRATDFANRIIKHMNTEVGSQDSETMSETAHSKFHADVHGYFNQCAPLKPLLGTITLHKLEAAPKERKQRQPRQKDQAASQTVQPKKLTDITDEDQNAKVTKHVEYIWDVLRDEYKRNDKKPISFYHFIVDPKSFSNTVENIFYVSFLIKDGFVKLNEGSESELPTLSVIRQRNHGSSQSTVVKKQLILTLDQTTWKEIVDGLKLEKAVIDQKSKSQHLSKRLRED